jgi:hypothetical protein
MQQKSDHAYRITQTQTGWEVTAFNRNTAVGPVTRFSDDALPGWLRKYIAVLKLVDHTGSIPGVGHRVGTVFWITNFTRTEHD